MDPAAEIHPPGCMLKIISISWNSYCHCHVSYRYHSTTMFSLTKIDTKSPLSEKSKMELQMILGKADTLSWMGFEVFLWWALISRAGKLRRLIITRLSYELCSKF
jgi:hypothetical protein